MSMVTFEKESVEVLIDKVINMLKELQKDIPAKFPTDKWLHAQGGSAENKPLFWEFSLMLTTDREVAKDFFKGLKVWAKQKGMNE